MKAKVINPMCLLYGETIDVHEKVVYVDEDNEEYLRKDLKFF